MNGELKTIERRLRQLRQTDGIEKRWDLNICEGLVREELANRLVDGRLSVEVKSDYVVQQSGNVAIEYRYRGQPSGIAATKAEYWWIFFSGKFYFDEVSVVIKTERLRALARHHYERGHISIGGDDNASEMVLVPKEDLLGLHF